MTQFNQRYQQVETQYNADQITIQQPPLSLTETQRKQNRTRMLDRVQAIWIDGVLEPSVQGAAQLTLELENKPSAIVTPLWQVLRKFDTTGRLSSTTASIVQVYDHANGEVLILGEPGAGKTTLLLELAHALLQRARQDEAHPIPVVFPLSSWATRRQPLTEWLASELHTRYQVPPPLAMSWIETDQVLPLLDGLDEVAAPHRAACVEAINSYRREHGLLPTVVCSRQADYFTLSMRLLLRTAVVVQPLTPEQIETYLRSGGERLEVLRETLRKDADLRVLASTPLMLNVLTVAYQETPHQEMTLTGSLGSKQEQVFASYVQRMLTHRSTNTGYTPGQIIHWLSRLAQQMKQQSQTIFYLERMQPDWLSGNWRIRAYDCLALRLPGILIGILVSLVIQLLFFSLPDLFSLVEWTLLGGVLGGIFSEARVTQQSCANEVQISSTLWSRLLPQLRAAILVGLGIGLIHGTRRGPANDPTHGLRYGLSHIPTYGLVHGLTYGLIFGLCSLLLQLLLVQGSAAHSPFPALSSAWEMRRKPLIRNTASRNGLLVGLLIGLAYGLSRALTYAPSYGLSRGLIYGLAYGLIGGFLSLLMTGRHARIQLVDRLTWSWRKLFSRRLVKASLRIMALIVVLYGLSVGLTYGPGRGLLTGLVAALGIGPSIGLTYGLLLGLFQGVSSETIEDQHRAVPNEGIRRSALNGLMLGIATFIILGLSGVISYELIYGLSSALRILPSVGLNTALSTGLLAGLSIGLSAGLLAGLLNGGLACLRHYVLRFLLWWTKATPWNYPHFLDVAAEHLLLRKVGGGYLFLHRLLLDYFAHLEIGSGSEVSAENRQEKLLSDTMPSASMEPTGADDFSDVPTGLLAPTPVLSDVPRLLPCGHEQRTPNARFCSVCGAPIPS